jgi:hypothetical protein
LTQATSNHKKKPEITGENSTHYIPKTVNRFELLSDLIKDADDYRPENDTKNHGTTQDAYKGSMFKM